MNNPTAAEASPANPSQRADGCSSSSQTARIGLISLCLAIPSLCGCRTAPDMRPFTDATAQLSSSIKTTGRTMVSEMDVLTVNWEDTQRKQALVTMEKFDQQWSQRNALADGLLDYSTSLAAIAAAGEQGQKSAQAVAASFKKLTDAVGVALPQAEAVGVAVNVGSYLYGKFAQDHAAKTFGESMTRLQPAVDETALLLGKSLDQIENGLDAVRDEINNNIGSETFDGTPDGTLVRTGRDQLKRLATRRTTLLAKLNSGNEQRDALRDDLLKAADPAKEKEFARIAALTTDIGSELAVMEQAIKSESEKLAPFDARAAAGHARITTEITLVKTIRSGLGDWAAAHSRLAAAALDKKTPQVADLVETALEIRELLKTVRAGQNP